MMQSNDVNLLRYSEEHAALHAQRQPGNMQAIPGAQMLQQHLAAAQAAALQAASQPAAPQAPA